MFTKIKHRHECFPQFDVWELTTHMASLVQPETTNYIKNKKQLIQVTQGQSEEGISNPIP
uniref:Uncharacterized protein n=1 Tax=Rhizophora mucronata TaxID=61149 RepID=A0A2P2Q4H5_RHIMU